MFGLFLGDTDFSKIVLKKVKKLNKNYFIIDFSKNNKFAKELFLEKSIIKYFFFNFFILFRTIFGKSVSPKNKPIILF